MRFNKAWWCSLLFGAVLLMITGCQNQTRMQHKPSQIRIVTSTPTYARMARQIVGDHGSVQAVMNNPNADPHDFEPTVKNAKQVAGAQFAIYNGLGYDDWMTKLLADNEHTKQLNVGRLLKKKRGANPHLWYDSHTLAKTANALTADLSRQYPQYRKNFNRNRNRYLQTLEPLQTLIYRIKQQRSQKLVAISEPVFDYSLKEMGYQIANPQFAKAIEEGSDPTPQDITHLQNLIKQRKIAFFVVNQQESSPVIDNLSDLAQKHQIPLLKVTETQPANQSYVQWLTKYYRAILKIEATHE
ncbi:zinc ABC transporter substrate-binding protein [Bombilactobacillus folatiphilus]|uniref:Zinc ABC transporter substrate-binding protein n=1 Tax=Bombilactobacillus folatiphilus TaxID=2923362 RepID=A0ABY4P8C8_9LACO|nr:zinc ABC transporter substrate-binding protein [Bombilactobacillus folatiphilus]UQS81965.1 zinc ABC transporter substrate-binding protein [Bombilactobacillus folatiphilus]